VKIEKVPSLSCKNCGSYCVIIIYDYEIECDDCNRITAEEVSELNLNNFGEDNEII